MIDTNVLSGAQLSSPPNQQQILIEVSAIAFAMQVINAGVGRLNQVLAPNPPPIEPQTKTFILNQLAAIQSAATAINAAAAKTTTLVGGTAGGQL
ncbi:MAG TPA: hypothetical protein VIF62_03310 [Labilithrix sp.]|jgi:hypothetical protein